MPIVVNLDVMLAKRKVKSKDLAEHIGITEANLSLLKSGKVKGVRFATLEAICRYLDCQPGDVLEYKPSPDNQEPSNFTPPSSSRTA
jgi:putative transcriptional regulator